MIPNPGILLLPSEDISNPRSSGYIANPIPAQFAVSGIFYVPMLIGVRVKLISGVEEGLYKMQLWEKLKINEP